MGIRMSHARFLAYQSKSDRRRQRRRHQLRRLLRWLPALLVAIFVAGFAIAVHHFWRPFDQCPPQVISPSETADDFSLYVARWGLFGPSSDDDPKFDASVASLRHQITGVRGYAVFDFHGSGTVYLEVTLTQSLADDLRAALQFTKKPNYLGVMSDEWGPKWWPKTWPADARTYDDHGDTLILPDSGTKAWFVFIGP